MTTAVNLSSDPSNPEASFLHSFWLAPKTAPMSLAELETPCLLLDPERLSRNIARMRKRLAAHGVPLRPHVKTAKSIDVVRLALAEQPGGITVSTLKEAANFLEHGIADITYAVGIAPNKLARAAALEQRGAKLTLLLDSFEQAEMLGDAAERLGAEFSALIEIDVDGHRAGLASDSDALVALGRRLHEAPGTRLAGVLTHAGGSYDCRSVDAIAEMAERERALTVAAAERLSAAGVPCETISVGSTPTATFARSLDGVTEVRAGVYMFQDLVQAGLGVCAIEDIAISVLAEVIGHRAGDGAPIVDAGWMALSRDRGTASQAVDQGYGLVCDASGAPLGDVIVAGTNQEHGILARRGNGRIEPSAFPVGTPLRILPNHACATAACFDSYRLIGPDGRPGELWHRFNGW